MATGNASNILVGSGLVFLAPDATANVADSVAEPLTPWTYIGYTEDGVDFDATRKEVMHRVDEQSNPLFLTIDTTETKLVTSLAESTLENMKNAFGGGTITTTAAGVGTIGKTVLQLADNVTNLALILQGVNPAGFFRRIYIPKIASIGKIKQEYNRAKKKQLLQVEFAAICPVQQIVVTDKTANALP